MLETSKSLILSIMQTLVIFIETILPIIAIIWLALLGNWDIIITGTLTLVFAPFLIGIFLSPVLATLTFFMKILNLEILTYIFILLGNLYTLIVMAGWGLYVLNMFTKMSSHPSEFVPICIVCFTLSTAPFMFMALKEDNILSENIAIISVFAFKIAYLFLLIDLFGFSMNIKNALIIPSCIMMLTLIIITTIKVKFIREYFS
ncbi:MAG: hypothetical protein PHX18_04140 [Candidatus Gastranaerophilales bacterium]|nr:hypothetical protein [Candidatus Gastranaerophilales bacterium]